MSEGAAYGFFYCGASKDEIEIELPIIRDCMRTPSDLELLLFKLPLEVTDKKLANVFMDAHKKGLNYVVQGNSHGLANEKVAAELGDILSQMYQTPLYNEGDEFRAGIVFEKDGDYLFYQRQ